MTDAINFLPGDQRCSSCRWWEEREHGTGTCWRFPPQAAIRTKQSVHAEAAAGTLLITTLGEPAVGVLWLHPRTSAVDACGCWEKKKEGTDEQD